MVGSGVKVSVGSCTPGCRVSDKAVWTNPAITVCATEVLMASGAGSSTGNAHPETAIDKMVIAKEIRLERSIVPPNKIQF
jgi:hypothetical protein